MIVSVNGLDPAGAAEGERLAIDGFELGAAVTVKLTVFELPPPGGGLATVTEKLPDVPRSDALRTIVS